MEDLLEGLEEKIKEWEEYRSWLKIYRKAIQYYKEDKAIDLANYLEGLDLKKLRKFLVSCCGNKNLYHFDLYILPLLEEKDE
jgi:hypothetical protein